MNVRFPPKADAAGTISRRVRRDRVDAAKLKAEADRCRMLASTLANQTTADMLNRMAAEFDEAAAEQESQLFFSDNQTKRGD